MNDNNQTIRNERDAQLAEYAERVAKQISESAVNYDETGEFPFEHFDILRKEGFFKLNHSKAIWRQGTFII